MGDLAGSVYYLTFGRASGGLFFSDAPLNFGSSDQLIVYTWGVVKL